MTKITIPSAPKTAFRISAKPTQPEKKDIERIGISIDEAAESLGVSIPTLLPFIRDRKIRTVRLGKRVIVSINSLREFVDGTEKHKSIPVNADKSDIACVAEGKEIIYGNTNNR